MSQSRSSERAESPAFGTPAGGASDTSRIRTAGLEDAAALARVASETFPLACPPHTTPQAIADFIAANLTEARFTEYLRDPARQLLLLEVGGADDLGRAHDVGEAGTVDAAAAGYAMVVHGAPSDPDVVAAIGGGPTTELSKLYVRPAHHGSGLASELMTASIGLAATHGSPTIWLGVNQLNERANRFYGKHGFEIAGPKRFLVGDRYERDWVRLRPLAR